MIDGRGNDPSQRQNRPTCEGNTHEIHETWGLASHPLASVYAPLQSFGNLYDLDTALRQGTIFTELDLPFMGRRIEKGGKCCG
ncbi:MAG: spore coat associated protein CotJA [Clostridia bacterium]|nr:spore coat associated protein CotJA [Clostridia bacterium]